jgi:hypothetical protein
MGFERRFVKDDPKRETEVVLTLSGRPKDLFSEKFIDFAKHSVVGFLAKEAQSGNDPDKIFERINESISIPVEKAATDLCLRMLQKLCSDPERARETCNHYIQTGELLEEIEL